MASSSRSTSVSETSEPSLSAPELGDGLREFVSRELGPIGLREVKFAVCQFPEQEIRQALLARSAYQQIRIRYPVCNRFAKSLRCYMRLFQVPGLDSIDRSLQCLCDREPRAVVYRQSQVEALSAGKGLFCQFQFP